MNINVSLAPNAPVSDKKPTNYNRSQLQNVRGGQSNPSYNQNPNYYRSNYNNHRGGAQKAYKTYAYIPKNQDSNKNEEGTEDESTNNSTEQNNHEGFPEQYSGQYTEDMYNAQYPVQFSQQQTGNLKYYQYVNEFPRASNYSSWESICETFPQLKNANSKTFETEDVKECRAFIIRSNNEDDVHKAIKYGIWTSTPRNNELLNKTFLEMNAKNIPIFLFYSVVKSGQFVGVAQMTSQVKETSSNLWWEAEKWLNQFEVKWLFIKDVSYKSFSHIIIDNSPISRAKDCTCVPSDTAFEMLKVIKARPNHPNIFSAFEYMDYREDYLRYYKSMMAQMQKSYFNDYMQQSMNFDSSKYAGNQYFKYNSFSYEKPQHSKRHSEGDHKTEDTVKLLREFETGLNLYDNEIKKWVKNSESNKYTEECQRIEKEIQEGLDDLEHKGSQLKSHLAEIKSSGTRSRENGDIERREGNLNSLHERLETLQKKFKETYQKFH